MNTLLENATRDELIAELERRGEVILKSFSKDRITRELKERDVEPSESNIDELSDNLVQTFDNLYNNIGDIYGTTIIDMAMEECNFE